MVYKTHIDENGTEYTQEFNLGNKYDSWTSYEKGAKVGEVRVILQTLHKAWNVSPRGLFKKPRVMWHCVNESDIYGGVERHKDKIQQALNIFENTQEIKILCKIIKDAGLMNTEEHEAMEYKDDE